jgi:hypothetical protein
VSVGYTRPLRALLCYPSLRSWQQIYVGPSGHSYVTPLFVRGNKYMLSEGPSNECHSGECRNPSKGQPPDFGFPSKPGMTTCETKTGASKIPPNGRGYLFDLHLCGGCCVCGYFECRSFTIPRHSSHTFFPLKRTVVEFMPHRMHVRTSS